jgi:hypothetical protein
MQKCIDMLVDEIEENGLATTLPKLAAYFPKEVSLDVEQTVSIDTTKLNREVLEAMYTAKEANDHNEVPDRPIH